MRQHTDAKHLKIQVERFHKVAALLASKVTGEPFADMLSMNVDTFPCIVSDGSMLSCVLARRPHRRDYDYITPYVVNAAFSMELRFKLLKLLETNEWISGHELIGLYNNQSDETKDYLDKELSSIVENSQFHKKLHQRINNELKIGFAWEMENLLTESSKAFEDWRYLFQNKPGWFAGYKEITLCLSKRIKNVEGISSL